MDCEKNVSSSNKKTLKKIGKRSHYVNKISKENKQNLVTSILND